MGEISGACRQGGERDHRGVPVVCARGTGPALAGAWQWIPQEHIDDPVTSLVIGLPLDPAFRTKGQLAIDLCTDTSADGLRFDFVCGDEVYGNCTQLRDFLEARGRGTCCGCGRTSTWRWPPGPP